MIYIDKTSYTSDPIEIGKNGTSYIWFSCTGGTVEIQIQEEDAEWRSYPETTFTEATAKMVAVPQGYIRVVVDAASPVTVSVRA